MSIDQQDPTQARVKDLEQALLATRHMLEKARSERDSIAAERGALQNDLVRVAEERNAAKDTRRALEFELGLVRDGGTEVVEDLRRVAEALDSAEVPREALVGGARLTLAERVRLLDCRAEVAGLRAERDEAQGELAALTEEVELAHAALTAGKRKCCAFCLFVCETAEEMQGHLKTCRAHPMREVELQRDELQRAVDKAMVDHSAVEAERARLAREVEQLRGERDSARKLAAESRKAGRAEAAAILMDRDAEDWDRELLVSRPLGDTGDYTTEWVPEAVLAAFDAEGSEMTSELDRLEGLYWERLAERDNTIEQLHGMANENQTLLKERDSARGELEKTQADLVRTAEERNVARESRRAMEFELKLLRDGHPAGAARAPEVSE